MARVDGYNTRPGYSAWAEARRRMATQPGWQWEVASALGLAFMVGLLLGRLTAWSMLLAPVLGVVLAVGLIVSGRRRREVVSGWLQGAKGEQLTARALRPLEREGWRIFHDLQVPGSAANIDHLLVGPGGVWVIDSKLWTGQLRWDPQQGWMHGQYPLLPDLNTTRWEAAQVEQALEAFLTRAGRHLDGSRGIDVHMAWCIHGLQLPGGRVRADGETIAAPGQLLKVLRDGRGPTLPPAAIDELAGDVETIFQPALPSPSGPRVEGA
jgi:hypothetical protein